MTRNLGAGTRLAFQMWEDEGDFCAISYHLACLLAHDAGRTELDTLLAACQQIV